MALNSWARLGRTKSCTLTHRLRAAAMRAVACILETAPARMRRIFLNRFTASRRRTLACRTVICLATIWNLRRMMRPRARRCVTVMARLNRRYSRRWRAIFHHAQMSRAWWRLKVEIIVSSAASLRKILVRPVVHWAGWSSACNGNHHRHISKGVVARKASWASTMQTRLLYSATGHSPRRGARSPCAPWR